MNDTDANNVRLVANDLIEQLRLARKRGQLRILSIQVGGALESLDLLDAKARANTSIPRTRVEQTWVERGAKGVRV